jgi:hypothetical protein
LIHEHIWLVVFRTWRRDISYALYSLIAARGWVLFFSFASRRGSTKTDENQTRKWILHMFLATDSSFSLTDPSSQHQVHVVMYGPVYSSTYFHNIPRMLKWRTVSSCRPRWAMNPRMYDHAWFFFPSWLL